MAKEANNTMRVRDEFDISTLTLSGEHVPFHSLNALPLYRRDASAILFLQMVCFADGMPFANEFFDLSCAAGLAALHLTVCEKKHHHRPRCWLKRFG
jgi:hypothetical protein